MTNLSTLLIFCLFAVLVLTSAFDSPTKERVITKLHCNVSDWLSREQYHELLARVEQDLRAGVSDMGTTATGHLLAVLSRSQYFALLGKGASFLFSDVSLVTLASTFNAVMRESLEPLMNDLTTVVLNGNAVGLSASDVLEQGYSVTNEFLTFARLNSIMLKHKAQWSHEQWETIYRRFQSIVHFEVYPDVKP